MEINHSEVSRSELDVFAELDDVQVVFDVGARMQMDSSTVPSIVDYIKIHPNATYHLFEPNKVYADALREVTKDMKNVLINQYGLGRVRGIIPYSETKQAFSGGEIGPLGGTPLPVKTLDWYVKKHNIERIDFLKIDTEGFDYNVLLGGKNSLKLCRYIQYEEWVNKEQFYKLLGKDFHMKEMGFRNVICVRK